MATTDRTTEPAPTETARRLVDASFAHLLVRADGASIAAAGLLADACRTTDTPYQASVVSTGEDARSRADAADESATVVSVGVPGHDGLVETPAVGAFEAASELDAEPDPALALAGVVAAESVPEDAAPKILERADVERRPGVAVPTTDLADGLAHTTLAHAPYSGDLEATEDLVAGIDADRRVASLLAIDAVTADGATERTATAIERAIHPLAGGPLETIGGYADVLCALAATAPGLGVGLGLGAPADTALDMWRDHARAVHESVRSADVTRHGGLLVARTDGPVEAVARLLRDFRSPEPAVLAIRAPDGMGESDGRAEAALATVDRPAEPIETAAEAATGSGLATGNRGYARFAAEEERAFVDAVREAI